MANKGTSIVLIFGILMNVSSIVLRSCGPGTRGTGEESGTWPAMTLLPFRFYCKFPDASESNLPPITSRESCLIDRAATGGVLQPPVPFHLGVDLLQAERPDHRADRRLRVVRPEQAQVLPRLVVVADLVSVLPVRALPLSSGADQPSTA